MLQRALKVFLEVKNIVSEYTFWPFSNVNVMLLGRYSINALDSIEFKTNLTVEEQSKVLNILNVSGKPELSRYNIPQNRIKDIVKWKNKNGPFKSLAEVLEVDGLSQHILEQMCDNIINNDCSSEVEISNSRSARTFKRLITPPIPIKLLNDLGTALGVYFSPVGMSWARMSKEDNYLLNWGFYSFCSLPKTMLSNDIFNLAVSALQKLPSADMYVLESMSNGRPTKMKLATIASDGQVELASMLIALLNTSMKHNTSLTSTDKAVASKEIIENRVFFLKSNVPARLFKILVGNEKVSAISKVTRLIENDGTFEVEVPCSPISVNSHLKQAFMAENSENKELLSQALMLVVTFMDVCVRKNPATLASISSPQSAAKG